MKAPRRALTVSALSVCSLLFVLDVKAQENQSRDTLISAARAIMTTTRYCSFVTLDASGAPQVRTMDPFAPDENMVVWLGTNPNSRKVAHIRNGPRVAIHYMMSSAAGYVTLHGRARIVDDAAAKAAHWKPDWESFYANRETDFVLIEVLPESLEVMDYSQGIVGDPVTWKTPVVKFSDQR